MTGCRGKGSNTSIWRHMTRGQNRKQKEQGRGSNTLTTVKKKKRLETTDVEIKQCSRPHSTLQRE